MSQVLSDSSTDSGTLVTVSELAAAKMQALLSSNADYLGIRLGVVGGGCAGLQYQMDPCTSTEEGDIQQTIQGIGFYIHPMVVPYLKGIHIDYTEALVDGGFRFSNPNATSTCGCGTSFGI